MISTFSHSFSFIIVIVPWSWVRTSLFDIESLLPCKVCIGNAWRFIIFCFLRWVIAGRRIKIICIMQYFLCLRKLHEYNLSFDIVIIYMLGNNYYTNYHLSYCQSNWVFWMYLVHESPSLLAYVEEWCFSCHQLLFWVIA